MNSPIEVSRGEFDMLARTVAENGRRLDTIDMSGTRGVGVVQVQLTELAKDVSALTTRMDRHIDDHEKEEKARLAQRRTTARWIIGTMIALVAVIETPLIYLISLH